MDQVRVDPETSCTRPTKTRAVLVALAIILAVSVIESLSCWDVFGPGDAGCFQPWRVGWPRYLYFLASIVWGPFLPWLHNAGQGATVAFAVTTSAIVLAPWVGYYFRPDLRWLTTAVALWLFLGFFFAIGIWV